MHARLPGKSSRESPTRPFSPEPAGALPSASHSLGATRGWGPQPGSTAPPVQRAAQSSGASLPEKLRGGLERMAGLPLDDVRVHYRSAQPRAVNAHAYAQANQIFLSPGQERHLPHEAWHVVQQRQGRVRANGNIGGMPLNDSEHLEREATLMGQRAGSFHGPAAAFAQEAAQATAHAAPVQRQPSDDEDGPASDEDLGSEAEEEHDPSDHEGASTPEDEDQDLSSQSSNSDEEEEAASSKARKKRKAEESAEDSDSEWEQGSESESESDDEEGEAKRDINPGAKMSSAATLSADRKTYSYTTVDGANHTEMTDDPDAAVQKLQIHTTGLKHAEGRGPTKRANDGYRIFSHYGDSPGQLANQQMPQAHFSPSDGGMGSGPVNKNEDYRNGLQTSKHRNNRASAFESGSLPKNKTYAYHTDAEIGSFTELEARHIKDIAAETTQVNPKWDEARIRRRFASVRSKFPKQKAILKEKRSIVHAGGKTTDSGEWGPDLFAGLPLRAYDQNGLEHYESMRKAAGRMPDSGGHYPSSGDDSELEEMPAKYKGSSPKHTIPPKPPKKSKKPKK